MVTRFRPFNDRERAESDKVSTDLALDLGEDGCSVQLLQNGKLKNTFVLDKVLPPTVTQVCVYDE